MKIIQVSSPAHHKSMVNARKMYNRLKIVALVLLLKALLVRVICILLPWRWC